jgi:hypothetical protein
VDECVSIDSCGGGGCVCLARLAGNVSIDGCGLVGVGRSRLTVVVVATISIDSGSGGVGVCVRLD